MTSSPTLSSSSPPKSGTTSSNTNYNHCENRYCPNNHPLVKDFPPAFSCDTCNRSYKAGTESHACRSCFYDTCLRCHLAPTCRGRHILSEGLVAMKFACDLCLKFYPAGTKAHSCRLDNFDVCHNCFETAVEKALLASRNSSNLNNNNNSRQQQQLQQQNQPITFQPHDHNHNNTNNNHSRNPSSPTSIVSSTFMVRSTTNYDDHQYHNNNDQNAAANSPSQQNPAATGSNTNNIQGRFPPEPPLSAPKGTRCKSVFVGCNYSKTNAELRGSINDVFTSMKLLRALGFDLAMTKVLVDDKMFMARTGAPDKKTIENALTWLVEGVRAGDHLFFHFAGHVAQIPCPCRKLQPQKIFSDALVPVDYQRNGYISEDWIFENVVGRVPGGVRLTILFDTAIYPATPLGDSLEFEWQYDPDLKRFKQTRRSSTRDDNDLRNRILSRSAGGDVVIFSTGRDEMTVPAPEGMDIGEYCQRYLYQHPHQQQNTTTSPSAATKNARIVNPGYESGSITHSLLGAIAPKVGADGKPHLTFGHLISAMQSEMNHRQFLDRFVNISCSKKLNFDQGMFSLFGELPSVL